MKIRIVIDQEDLKCLVIDHISELIGDRELDVSHLSIETKSTQNYRSEWEGNAGFRAVYDEDTTRKITPGSNKSR